MTTQVAPIVGPSAQNSLLKIQKATIKKQLLSAEFTEQLTLEAKPRNFQVQTDELVHPDLEKCFAQLVPHFALLTEQLDEHAEYEAANGYWPTPGEKLSQHFDGYGVTGIIMSSKASGGVTLMGFRTMESGKIQNMTAQFVSFAEQSEELDEVDVWHYKHTDELQGAVEMALEEVELALRGKCSEVGRQLNMFEQKQLTEEVVDDLIDSK